MGKLTDIIDPIYGHFVHIVQIMHTEFVCFKNYVMKQVSHDGCYIGGTFLMYC